jgi:hypothetical protein
MKTRDELAQEARTMTDAELRRSLDWNNALDDHYGEIGEYHGNDTKAEIIRMELARRNR